MPGHPFDCHRPIRTPTSGSKSSWTASPVSQPPIRWASLGILAIASVLGWGNGAAAADTWSTFIDGTAQTGIAALENAVWVSSSGGATGFAPADSTYERRFQNDGLPAHDLTAIGRDDQGNLWYGSRSRGLQVESPAGRFLIRPLDQFDLGADSVRVLAPAGDRMWVGTTSGAALVAYPPDPSRPSEAVLETFDLESFLGQTPNVSAIAARGDTTWFGTQRGIVRREPDGTRSILNAGLTDLDVRGLAVSGGFLWAGTRQGVFRLEDNSWVSRATGLAAGQVFQAFVEFEGALHVGAAQGTVVYRLSGLTWSARASGLANLSLTGFGILDQTLYAASSRGLHVLGTNNTWRRIPSPDPPGPGRLAFDQDWVDVAVIPGTEHARAINHLLVTEAVDGFRAVPRGTQGIEAQDLSRILIDGAGQNWLGHCCCGTETTCRLDRLADFSATADPHASFDLRSLVEGPDGRIWGASDGYGVYAVEPATGQVTSFRPTIGLSSAFASALAFDGDGRLWIGYGSSGVDLWSNPGRTPASITHFGVPQGLPTPQVTALAARENEVWVGTTAGAVIFRGSVLVHEITASELPDPRVADLAFDGCGRIWIATGKGVAVADRDGNLLQVYDDQVRPGIVDQRVRALDVDLETGHIWFATEGGLSRYAYDQSCSQAAAGGSCTELCPFPNPFDPARSGALKLTGPVETDYRITVVDAAGRELWSGSPAGDGTFWDGRDQDGDPVPSGVYLVQIAGLRLDPIVRRVAVRW
jgi:ligand-binding sensor domain-containing protein